MPRPPIGITSDSPDWGLFLSVLRTLIRTPAESFRDEVMGWNGQDYFEVVVTELADEKGAALESVNVPFVALVDFHLLNVGLCLFGRLAALFLDDRTEGGIDIFRHL